MPGVDTSPVEVSGVTKLGVWLRLDDEQLFMPFDQFPWFRTAAVSQIFEVERLNPQHLYWPELDVDLHIDSIRHPENFPLVAQPPR